VSTNYSRGARIEYRAVQHLEHVGYFCVRSAGSHSPVDVVAVGPAGIRLIQIKRAKDGYLSPGELETAREQLRTLPCPAGVSREIWVWKDRLGWIRQEVV